MSKLGEVVKAYGTLHSPEGVMSIEDALLVLSQDALNTAGNVRRIGIPEIDATSSYEFAALNDAYFVGKYGSPGHMLRDQAKATFQRALEQEEEWQKLREQEKPTTKRKSSSRAKDAE